jgi:uncharacterized protein Yka (UPF0111/DUF47 family)
MMAEVRKIKDLVHELVDKGVTTVEEIHQSITQVSHDNLKGIAPEEVKPIVDKATDIHDTATRSVYDTIRTINHKVSEISDEVITKVAEASKKVADSYEDAVDPYKSKEA